MKRDFMTFAKLTASLESNSVQSVQDELKTTEVSNQVTDATIGLEENISDIESTETVIEKAEEGADKLTEVIVTVKESSEDTGTLSPLEQSTVAVTHETIMASLGYSTSVFSMESFNVSRDAGKTIATLEASANSIFDKVLQAIKNAFENLLIFVQKLLSNNFLLQRYWEKINKQVSAVSGKGPNDKTMTESARALASPFLEARPNDIQSTITGMHKTAMGMLDVSMLGLKRIDEINFKFKGEVNKDVSEFMNLGDYGIPRLDYTIVRDTKNSQGHNIRGNLYGYLVNGRSMNVVASISGISSAVKEYVRVATEAKEIPVASVDILKDTMAKAAEIMKGVKEFDSKRSYIKNAISRIMQSLAQSQLVGVPSLVSSKAREIESDLGYIRGLRSVINSIIGRFPLECFKIAKAFIDYCANSLKHYDTAAA